MKIRIFTDGACSGNPGYGGYAFVIALKDKQIKFSESEKNTTNNRMELKAVISSLQCLLRNESKIKKYDEIEIISDSAYVVNSINQKWIELWQNNNWKNKKLDDVKNVDLWKMFIELRSKLQNKNISFHKVKGHSGDCMNEMVDKLAREKALELKRRCER